MRSILALLMLVVAPAWAAQIPIECAPGVPCSIGGPVNTKTGDSLPTVGASLNSMFAEMYGKFAGQNFVAASGDTTGVTDLANLQAAAANVASSARQPPLASAFFPTGKIVFGPGTFFFKSAFTNILGAQNLKMQGIWIEGSGRGVTSFDYNPNTSGPFLVNNRGLNVKISDMTFIGHDPNSDFLWSQEQAGLSSVQDYTFTDVDWQGSWQWIARLTGGNNNSEWKFDRDSFTGNFAGMIYTPPAVTLTIVAGSASPAISNTAEQIVTGDTGSLSAPCAPLQAGTQYYVVNGTPTNLQLSTTPGGSPVTFTASCSLNFQTSSDQFLNFWFSKIKWWTQSSLGQWLVLNAGGSVKIRDSDISGHSPASVAYVFNLLGASHAGGTMSFEVDGLRVEHANDNSRLIKSQWNGGSIAWMNLDESSQAGQRNITNQYASYQIVNSTAPLISYRNSQLMGQHLYTTGVASFNFQSDITYDEVTLIDNPTAANFISLTTSGNAGGNPRIRFTKSKNLLNATTVGYHEIVDTDLFWNKSTAGQTNVKTVSCLGANGDFPFTSGKFAIRLPLNAMITSIRYWNPSGSSAGGAYQYTIQTEEAVPTVLAGGAGTGMSGTNASIPLAVTSAYVVNSVSLPFEMTTDAQRTIDIIDTQNRSGVFTGPRCLIDYIG